MSKTKENNSVGENVIIGTREFIQPWISCADEEDVPQACQTCYYLNNTRDIKPESICSFVSLYDVKKKMPVCPIGLRILKSVGEKATLFQLIDAVYGWTKI